jgi:hypothetical protein
VVSGGYAVGGRQEGGECSHQFPDSSHQPPDSSHHPRQAPQDYATAFRIIQRKRLPHEVLETMSGFVVKSFEEMHTLCRFFVLEGCYTAEQLAALSEDEVRALDELEPPARSAARRTAGLP